MAFKPEDHRINIHHHENFRSSVKLTCANTITFYGVFVGDNVLYFANMLIWFGFIFQETV
jgi:hypothetical protein